jgi:hypothetical protein
MREHVGLLLSDQWLASISHGVFPSGKRDAEQIRHRLTGLIAAAKLFGVIGDADRVLGKCPAMEIAAGVAKLST